MTKPHKNAIIVVNDTFISLPSGRMLALDAQGEFNPSSEFWRLWKSFKAEVRRAGIGVRLCEKTGEWRGYVQTASQALVYSQPDQHALWIDKARAKAESDDVCEAVIVSYQTLPRPRPKLSCLCFKDYEIAVTSCRDGTFQLRLLCQTCGTKTRNAIAYDRLGPDLVINAIAHELQSVQTPQPITERFKDVNWV